MGEFAPDAVFLVTAIAILLNCSQGETSFATVAPSDYLPVNAHLHYETETKLFRAINTTRILTEYFALAIHSIIRKKSELTGESLCSR